MLMRTIKILLLSFLLILGIGYCLLFFFTDKNVDSLSESIPPSRQIFSEADEIPVQELDDTSFSIDFYDVIFQGTINQGDTAGKLLREWVSEEDYHSFIASCEKVYSLHQIKTGQPYTVIKEEGDITRFEYEIDMVNKLVVCKIDDTFQAVVEPIQYEISVEKVTGTIQKSLFDTMAELNESASLAVRLADIFAWEINFIRDIRPEDSFSLLVEKKFRNGEFKGYGKLLAATFINQGKNFDAFLYPDEFGKEAYYNSKGESVKRAFLKAPLSFTRISSRFSPKRFHPVLKTWKAHPAIDYAAPTGTPVKAIGSGKVIFIGQGKGAGNYITLKHANGFESMYLHLSGFAKDLKKGKRISQGEVIGFVGSTGYSTGPHLDFRMKKNGTFVNPETMLSPRDTAIAASNMSSFKKTRNELSGYLQGTNEIDHYFAQEGLGTNEQ